jgi:hypothetical protein
VELFADPLVLIERSEDLQTSLRAEGWHPPRRRLRSPLMAAS